MFSDKVLLLPPALLPSATYYAAMLLSPRAVIDTSMRYDKRAKSVHRTVLQTSHGISQITIPIEKPVSSRTTWDTIRISGHGAWWRTIKSTLATIFGPTPFFEYYRDFFDCCFDEKTVGSFVTGLDLTLDAEVRRLLGIPTRVSITCDSRDHEFIDLRHRDFNSSTLHGADGSEIILPQELMPGRSILEPLFRLGPDETCRLMKRTVGMSE